MHGFKFRIDPGLERAKSVGDNNFIFSLLENKTGDSDLLIRSLSARMDRGRFVPELERPSNLHNERTPRRVQ